MKCIRLAIFALGFAAGLAIPRPVRAGELPQADGIWLDLGFPIVREAGGKKFRPLLAPLIVDLDTHIARSAPAPALRAGEIERITIEGGKVEIVGDTVRVEGGKVEVFRRKPSP